MWTVRFWYNVMFTISHCFRLVLFIDGILFENYAETMWQWFQLSTAVKSIFGPHQHSECIFATTTSSTTNIEWKCTQKNVHYHIYSFPFTCFHLVEHGKYLYIAWSCWILATERTYRGKKKVTKTSLWYSVSTECFNCTQVCIKYTHEIRWMQKTAKWQKKNNNFHYGKSKAGWSDFRSKNLSAERCVSVIQLNVQLMYRICMCIKQSPSWVCVVLMLTN